MVPFNKFMVLYGTTNYNKTKFIMVPLIKIYGTNIYYKKKILYQLLLCWYQEIYYNNNGTKIICLKKLINYK